MPRIAAAPVAEKVDRATFENEIKPLNRPVVLKGLATSWPCVERARQSPHALADYLKVHDAGAVQRVAVCPAQFNGQFFYNAEMTGFNFGRSPHTLSQTIDLCLAAGKDDNAYYLEAALIDTLAPGLNGALDMALLDPAIRPRMWLGTSLRTQTHFDMCDNIAVHVAGEKVFTLFPPEQIANLYPGPMELTPAGVPISMVSLEAPDFDRYPRFHDALDAALEAPLEPGDGLYIPALWWHHVSTTGPLNMLVNFWWSERRSDTYSPISALYMAALSYKHMPAAERKNWAALMNYYVFEEAGDPVAHLPAQVHTVFGPDPSAREMAQLKANFRRQVRL